MIPNLGEDLSQRSTAPTVGIVTSSLSPAGGGIFEVVRHTAARLANDGVRARVLGLCDGPFRQADFGTADVAPYAVLGSRKIGFAPRLLPDLLASGVDLVHLHGLWMYPSLAVRLWHARTGRPLVISPHGMLEPWALERGAWKKRASRFLFETANLRRAAVLHAVSEQELAAIRDFGLRNPVAVIPNGAELEEAPQGSAVDADGRRVLLFLGRLHPKKGLLELVEAWAQALERAPRLRDEWRVEIAGWEDGAGYADALRAAIAARGLTADIRLIGGVAGQEKAATYRAASAFVLPSRSEGMPLVVLEAWAHGLPVFMTEACNIPAGFRDDAALAITTDPRDMADVFLRALPDVERLAAIGRAGRALVAREFSWNVTVRRLSQLYDYALDGGATPPFVHRA